MLAQHLTIGKRVEKPEGRAGEADELGRAERATALHRVFLSEQDSK